jgi:hypothetical protein
LSFAEAQQRVSFPIIVPRSLPRARPTEVATFAGARIHEAAATELPPAITAAGAGAQRAEGDGVLWSFETNRVMVYALMGSPAQKAGLGTTKVQLLAIGGQPLDAKQEIKRHRAFLDSTAKARHESGAANGPAVKAGEADPLTIRLSQRPLWISVKGASGEKRELRVPDVVEPSVAARQPIARKAGEVALIYQIGRSKFTIIERFAPDEPVKPPAGAELRRGWARAEVWVFGPDNGIMPSAVWREGQLIVTLENTAGLDNEGVSMIIESMHVPADPGAFQAQG